MPTCLQFIADVGRNHLIFDVADLINALLHKMEKLFVSKVLIEQFLILDIINNSSLLETAEKVITSTFST